MTTSKRSRTSSSPIATAPKRHKQTNRAPQRLSRKNNDDPSFIRKPLYQVLNLRPDQIRKHCNADIVDEVCQYLNSVSRSQSLPSSHPPSALSTTSDPSKADKGIPKERKEEEAYQRLRIDILFGCDESLNVWKGFSTKEKVEDCRRDYSKLGRDLLENYRRERERDKTDREETLLQCFRNLFDNIRVAQHYNGYDNDDDETCCTRDEYVQKEILGIKMIETERLSEEVKSLTKFTVKCIYLGQKYLKIIELSALQDDCRTTEGAVFKRGTKVPAVLIPIALYGHLLQSIDAKKLPTLVKDIQQFDKHLMPRLLLQNELFQKVYKKLCGDNDKQNIGGVVNSDNKGSSSGDKDVHGAAATLINMNNSPRNLKVEQFDDSLYPVNQKPAMELFDNEYPLGGYAQQGFDYANSQLPISDSYDGFWFGDVMGIL